MDFDKAEANLPLLDEEVESSAATETYEPHQLKRRSFFVRNNRAILGHTLIAMTYFFLITIAVRKLMPRLPNLIYIPARDVLEWQVAEMYTSEADPSPYMGMSDESDAAWHELMQHTSFRLTDEELRRLNRTSVALGDGGYMAMPTVFHELHCLKMVRWNMNLTRYGHWFGVRDHEELHEHIDHCMDVIRQSIMCRADMSPMTFDWTLKSRVPEANFDTDHECINWNKVEAWLEERRVDIYAPGILNHPVYGPSYPGGHRLIEEWDVPKTLPFQPLPGKRES
ncbi:hypothetical protein F5Y09DRAFT_166537 [Xylaria sp. FL1042]|nr:hypothetical protein F5Y09DRAFT_166537 [Xylaria sp. FL1042]